MTIEEVQNEIINEFSMFDDWEERYQYMIDLGKTLPLIEAQYKTEDNIIKGCQSKVWVHASMQMIKSTLPQIVMPLLPKALLQY